ncbi:hypothetical protein J4219_06605 [Candidatus Woesearchaeota archaeon]|nr:hypothetical protein [Candidatus Woesearchaeota archaeon]
MSDDLEGKVSINKSRVAWNAVKGGVLGAVIPPQYYLAPLFAAAGAGLTIYDESKNVGLDLSKPFWGVFIGGFIGSFFDINHNDYFPHVATYAGIAFGAGLGFVEAYGRRAKRAAD